MKKILAVLVVLVFQLTASLVAGTAQSAFQRAPTWVYDYFAFDVPGVSNTRFEGINNHNDIVGESDGVRASREGFVLSGGVLTTFVFLNPPFAGNPYSPTHPRDINDAGVIVGRAGDGDGSIAFRYEGGVFSTLAGGGATTLEAWATGINNGGHVVGWYQAVNPFANTFINQSFLDSQIFDHVYFMGNNDAGHIAASGTFPDGVFRPFLQAGPVTTVITLPVSPTAAIEIGDVNNHDAVVGYYQEDPSAPRHGFVWMNGKAAQVDYPGAVDTSVNGINDAGVIVGNYTTTDFQYHGFAAVPRSPVTLTVNGAPGPATILRSDPLRVDVAFKAPPGGPLNPAEMYIGVVAPYGVFWLTPSGALVSTPTRAFAGPMPDFGPLPAIQLASASALLPGNYTWFAIVDDDTNGVPNGSFYDVAQVTVR